MSEQTFIVLGARPAGIGFRTSSPTTTTSASSTRATPRNGTRSCSAATVTAAFIAFWPQDDHVVAGMNVNVWDANKHVQALIRPRQAVDVAALADFDTPLESLAGQPAS